MIQSCITVSLVQQARGGPFVFWDDLEAACRRAAELGFDAIEIFAPGPDALTAESIGPLLDQYRLRLGAVGTGAGMVLHGLQLCDADPARRKSASDFIRSIIDCGAAFDAPAIIGSMQGRHGGEVDRETAMGYLRDSLNELGGYAAMKSVPLIYEPLNRYETNLVNTVADGVALLSSLETDNVKLLADLFHMNIEEADIAAAFRHGGGHIGHVHFVDSNRQPLGAGHLDFAPVAEAIREIGYDGMISAEAFPLPDPDSAARLTMESYTRWFSP